MSASKDSSGELLDQNDETKRLILAEACLWHDRDIRPEWERFR